MFTIKVNENYGQNYKMDYLPFVNITKAIFRPNSYSISTTNFNNLTKYVVLINFVAIYLLQAIQKFEGKYFRFYEIHITQI